MKIFIGITILALLFVASYNCQTPQSPNLRIVLLPATVRQTLRQHMSTPTAPTPELTTSMPIFTTTMQFTTVPPQGARPATQSPLRSLSTAQLLMLKQFYFQKYLEISNFIDSNLEAH